MQAPIAANDFLSLLEKSGLLSADQVRKATEKFGLTEDLPPEQVARRLVKALVLTPFQAERLLEGRYRGFLIDRYRVREVLGVGGMGCVYIAVDTEEKRKVALKILSAQHALDAGMLTRMKLEAHAGMIIKHPNVVETYRIGSTGAVNFMTMELVRGISMHELVALNGPIKWQMACDMFMQAATGLQAAHDKQIYHRDIKPANLLIDSDGTTKLLDFGLALLKAEPSDEFSLSMIFGHDCLGTPDYIAPEQSVDSNAIDGRADIYSLGCTFYVALTGRVPFPEKSNTAKIAAQRNKTARPIRDIRPEVPEEVAAIVERMMAKRPEDRFATATDVANALRPLASRRPVNFEFRELVTLRARQARQKEATTPRSSGSGPRSSITSASAWMGNPSHHLAAEIDTFTADDTPAIRQPAPARRERGSDSAPRRPSRMAPHSGSNVPRGWILRRLKTRQQISVTRVKTRIGTATECELPMHGSCSDERQCVIEFTGDEWHLKQESKAQPTFVDGKPQTFAKLKHGSKVTFADGSGFVLLNVDLDARRLSRRRRLLAWLVPSALAAIAAAVVWYTIFR
ncbi:MAG: FHA domain-containing serine/threonine-protein kinase [Planctomycetaceae bacterium]